MMRLASISLFIVLFRLSVAALLTLLITACGTTEISAARLLATAGSKAATELQTAAQAIYTDAQEAPKLEAFEVALISGAPPTSGIDAAVFERVTQGLRKRVEVAGALVAVYSSFGKLANYDASAEMETALGGLIDGVNGFGASFGLGAIPNLASEAVKIAGGNVISGFQARRLDEANSIVLQALRSYKAGLERPGVKDAVTAMARDNAARRYNVMRVLWERGLLSSKPLIDGIAWDRRLATVEKLDYTSGNAKLAPAITAYLSRERDARLRSISEEYEASAKVIGGLITQHEAFAKGQPVDFAAIVSLMGQLGAIGERLKAARELDLKGAKP